MTWINMLCMDTSTWKWGERYGDYCRRASKQTNAYSANLRHVGTMRVQIPPDWGVTKQDQSCSTWWLIILGSNASTRTMCFIWYQALRSIIHLSKIVQGTCTVGSNLIGIITSKQWIYQCQVISRKNYRNMGVSFTSGHRSAYSAKPKQFGTEAQAPTPQRISKAGHKGHQTCQTNCLK